MAKFSRVEIINKIFEVKVLPLFYHDEVESSVEVIKACSKAGAKVIEFTNRGEKAYPIFSEVLKIIAKEDDTVILGIGSVIDAPTAALFMAVGANFIVGPSFNHEIAKLCNRRKMLYIPGTATATEIATAEEYGAEICKIFPGSTIGGPSFIKSVMAPCPWHRLMPTGGVDATEESISSWIKAGAVAVGMGSNLITPQTFKEKTYTEITEKVVKSIEWARKAKTM